MYKIPLSVTPFDADGISKLLRTYDGLPAMQLVDDFETELKKYTGARYALALNSGTASIHLALKALGVGPGDTVVAPSFTYVATVNPIIYLGASPILVDSESSTWNMSPELLEKAILDQMRTGHKPKCIIVVHAYGMPAMMNALQDLSHKYEIPILEDAAEAIGSTYYDKVVGTLGKVGIFSFNNNKILTTYGGGAIITQDKGIYEKALFWASQAREDKPFYEHKDIGFNYRMSPLNAAAGLVGFRNIGRQVEKRRLIYDSYRTSIAGMGIGASWLLETEGSKSNRWLSTLLLKPLKISQIAKSLDAASIESRRLWNPMHLQPFYQKYPSFINGFSQELFKKGLSLPSCKLEDVDQVLQVLQSVG